MLNSFISSEIGFAHLLSASLALIFGSIVLADAKGTVFHRRIGYLYTISMIALNITALMIYRLFGKFGVFHVAAIVSLLTLLAGMIPVILKKPRKNWLGMHFSFMYWSVLGLYAAFIAEMATRLPIKTMFSSAKTFFMTVAIATALTMIVGEIVFYKKKKAWHNINTASKANEGSLSKAEDFN